MFVNYNIIVLCTLKIKKRLHFFHRTVALEFWNALTTKNPIIVAAAIPKPAFHQSCGSLDIKPNCFSCLKKVN